MMIATNLRLRLVMFTR